MDVVHALDCAYIAQKQFQSVLDVPSSSIRRNRVSQPRMPVSEKVQ
jgi:hypothetical protein